MQETRVQSLGWEDPLEDNGYPLQYSCLENPMDRGLQSVGRKQSDMTEPLTLSRDKGMFESPAYYGYTVGIEGFE